MPDLPVKSFLKSGSLGFHLLASSSLSSLPHHQIEYSCYHSGFSAVVPLVSGTGTGTEEPLSASEAVEETMASESDIGMRTRFGIC
ncbi:hypothetical protein Bca4012_027005 [Brassica carinata]|uniref:Uncharacterized protein n=1 Tax=Brassica carinata TaxID=52824 RepID=A0A8X7VJM2_BRACI|nr:hypothetical protein Bca52824_024011 [Brassica carinata]